MVCGKTCPTHPRRPVERSRLGPMTVPGRPRRAKSLLMDSCLVALENSIKKTRGSAPRCLSKSSIWSDSPIGSCPCLRVCAVERAAIGYLPPTWEGLVKMDGFSIEVTGHAIVRDLRNAEYTVRSSIPFRSCQLFCVLNPAFTGVRR